VTIPRSKQYDTDSGAGEFSGDHTIFGMVYDHNTTTPTIYWRSYDNQQLKKIDMTQLQLDEVGGEKQYMSIVDQELSWFDDATGSLKKD